MNMYRKSFQILLVGIKISSNRVMGLSDFKSGFPETNYRAVLVRKKITELFLLLVAAVDTKACLCTCYSGCALYTANVEL